MCKVCKEWTSAVPLSTYIHPSIDHDGGVSREFSNCSGGTGELRRLPTYFVGIGSLEEVEDYLPRVDTYGKLGKVREVSVALGLEPCAFRVSIVPRDPIVPIEMHSTLAREKGGI